MFNLLHFCKDNEPYNIVIPKIFVNFAFMQFPLFANKNLLLTSAEFLRTTRLRPPKFLRMD